MRKRRKNGPSQGSRRPRPSGAREPAVPPPPEAPSPSLPLGFLLVDAKGLIHEATPMAASLLGTDHATIVGKSLASLVPRANRPTIDAFLARANDAMSPGTCEICPSPKGDAPRQIRFDLLSVAGADRAPGLSHIVITDVLHLSRAEERLRASEERFRALATDAPIGLFLADPGGNYEYVNPRWCEMTGLSLEEALRDGWARGVHPDDRKAVIANWRKVTSSGGEWEIEHRFLSPSGRVTWVFAHTAPLIGDDGQACGYIGTCIDVTDQKLAERALRESEERYRALFEEAPVAYQCLDAAGHILDVNDPWLMMLGYSREEVIGKSFDDFLQPGSVPAFWEHFARLKGTRTQPEALFGMLRKDGARILVSADTRVGHDPKGQFRRAHCILHNVTEKERLQAELRRLATAIAHAGDCIMVTDADARIQYINPAFSAVTGYSHAEAIGANPRILKSGEHEASFYQKMWATISRGETFRGRMVNRRKDGSLYTADATISPVFDASGNLTHYVAVTRDVTREIQLERQYRQAQKLEAIGHLAGGVAHDFNNLLQVIDSCAKNAIAALPAVSPATGDLRDAVAACEQAASLVRRLRAFSRRQVMRPARFDLNGMLARSTETLAKVIGAKIRLEFRPADAPLWVWADPGMLEQLLVNLAINARDAMPDGGSLGIAARRLNLSSPDAKAHPCGKAGAYAWISVRDTGRGMDAAALARVFEPYQGAEGDGGSGLCLSAAYGIVEQHGGTIAADSAPGQGTVFDAYFPINETVAPESEALIEVAPAGGTETILLAEDHDVVRRLAQQALERAGYTVLAARDGEEAVSIFRAHADQVRLLLLDVVMPNLHGPDAYEAIRAIRPGIPALFQSGQHETTMHTDLILGPGVALIQKPYDQTALLRKVREVLDAPPSVP